MTLQNKIILDKIMAEDQGVCMRIGAECCTLIQFTQEGRKYNAH